MSQKLLWQSRICCMQVSRTVPGDHNGADIFRVAGIDKCLRKQYMAKLRRATALGWPEFMHLDSALIAAKAAGSLKWKGTPGSLKGTPVAGRSSAVQPPQRVW